MFRNISFVCSSVSFAFVCKLTFFSITAFCDDFPDCTWKFCPRRLIFLVKRSKDSHIPYLWASRVRCFVAWHIVLMPCNDTVTVLTIWNAWNSVSYLELERFYFVCFFDFVLNCYLLALNWMNLCWPLLKIPLMLNRFYGQNDIK